MHRSNTPSTQTLHPVNGKDTHTLFFAGGCFWGLEAYFKNLPGIQSTEVGYANGSTENPSYEEVCHQNTGHAETVAVTYDRNILPTAILLEAFFYVIDPTTLDRQGNDFGKQYRSGIFYRDDDDRILIENEIAHQQKSYKNPLVTEVERLKGFWSAENYHQDYLDKNPFGYCHINPFSAQRFIQEKGLDTKNPVMISEDTDAQILEHQYQNPNDEELCTKLTDEQYRVIREAATEAPYTNKYCDTFERGLYVDIATGEPLFTSMDKFESGCGWPSFSKPIVDDVLTEHEDNKLFPARTEVRSRAGKSHLGHVFPDGPKKRGGLRYCINSAALRFIPYHNLEKEGYAYLVPLFDNDGNEE